jgi:hypothetical protein
MEEGHIRLNTEAIGTVQLDSTEIRGEGGAHDPRLVLPIKVELNQQPKEQQIVIIRLSASLHLDHATGHSDQFASKVSYDLFNSLSMCSSHTGSSKHHLDICFNLTHAQLKALENRRHEQGKDLYLRLEPIVAWNKHTGNQLSLSPDDVSTLQEGGWDSNVGMFSEFAFFWLPKVEKIRLDFAKIDWVGKIFPGMGYDTFRLIEIKLPQSGARLIPEDALGHFKKAIQNYDRGATEDSLRECRLAHEAIEKEIDARLSTKLRSVYKLGREHKLGEAIALDLGWTQDSEQQKFINGIWKPLYVMANASAHTPSTKSLLPADAHAVLILTAAMLEYLAQLE